MSVLIKNGRIVTAVDDYVADIFINGSTVALIGKDLAIEADKRIDASGKLVIPGGIDPHTHLELPFGGTTASDTFETGTRAAAFGGTTCIIDFAVQTRGTSTLKALDTWHAKAEGKTAIDYALSHDRHRHAEERDRRDGSARRRGHHQFQAVHGLSGRASGR